MIHQLNIAVFTGDPDQIKKGVTFEAWKFEVLTLKNEGVYSRHIIMTAAKKSLRDEAAKVCRRFGINAPIDYRKPNTAAVQEEIFQE